MKSCAESMGHQVSLINELDIHLEFGSTCSLLLSGQPFPDVDVILVRPLIAKDPANFITLLRQFEQEGFLVMNGSRGVEQACNKIRTLQILSEQKLPIPKTVVLSSANQLDKALSGFRFPVVVKAVFGSGGAGTFLAESLRSMRPLVEHLLKETFDKEPIKIQEYIKESKGKDLRVFVVGNKVVATMERSAKKGDFRANIHRGGVGKLIEPTPEEVNISLAATKAVGLDIAGVDILRTKSGPVIIEVNSTPGFEGIMQATGIDVVKRVVDYTIQKARAHKRKRKT